MRASSAAWAWGGSCRRGSRPLARLAAQQQLLVNQLKALNQDLANLLKAEPKMARKLGQLTSIPGIGLMTAIVLGAETNGFVLVENE
jgi:transposase